MLAYDLIYSFEFKRIYMTAEVIDNFLDLPDPRVDRTKKYPLIEIIFLVIAAILSGCEGWHQIKDFGDAKLDWLRKFFPYTEGIPVDDTIARLMRKLDTEAFQSCFLSWMSAVSKATNGDIIAIDGKTLRGSQDRKNGCSPIHMVSAWSSLNGVVLGQEKTAEKSNEITAIPKLLEALDIAGCIITIDAMGCQTKIASQIVNKDADYMLALKGNQGNLHSEIKGYFEDAFKKEFKNIPNFHCYSVDPGHGRIEKRECWVIKAEAEHLPSITKWDHLENIVAIKSTRTINNKMSEEIRYFITSATLSAEKALHVIRSHWGIENSLHWTLDVSFGEDKSRVRAGASAENLGIMRHIALNILKGDKNKKISIPRKRNLAAFEDDYREQLIRNSLNLS